MITKRTVHVALYDTLADWETGYVTAYVQRHLYQAHPGTFEVRYVGRTTDPVTTMGNLTAVPDLATADLRAEDSALLVLPGSETWESGELADWGRLARTFVDAGTPVAAICGATYGLAAEGLLDDRDHTSADPSYLAMSGYAGGEHYRDVDAVTDRGVTTAGPTHPVAFAREVFGVLGSHTPEVVDAWYRLNSEHQPEAFFELSAAAGE